VSFLFRKPQITAKRQIFTILFVFIW
jgi:hypothetical protein